MDGSPIAQAPRIVLKKLIETAKTMGLRVKTGVEAEFFLLSADGTAISDAFDASEKPCYDQQALMRRYDIISEICDAMLALGWKPYQNDHEDANGQFEMNWEFDDALATATSTRSSSSWSSRLPRNMACAPPSCPSRSRALRATDVTVISRSGTSMAALTPSRRQRAIRPLRARAQFPRRHHQACIRTGGGDEPHGKSYKRINAPRTQSGATGRPIL